MAGWLFVQLSLHLLTRSCACADPRELKWNCKALVLLCLKEKKSQKSRSACNLHNSFPADIDRVFIKPMTFFSFLFLSFFSFCEYVLFADCPEYKQYILWSSIDHLQGGLRRLVWRKPKNWKALHNMSIQSIAHGGGMQNKREPSSTSG